MQRQSLWHSISLFETGLSAAEWGWRIATLLFIGGSGTLTAFVAKADPILKQLGPIYWVAAGCITALVVSIILYLIKSAVLKQASADLHRALLTPKSSINPLLESFKDSIIPIEDLRLPTVQLHENKHFKRCKFVGPAAVAILGGNYVNSGFSECGDIVALPEDVFLTGIVVLKNCTVEECEFIRTTIFTDQNTAKGFATVPGAIIKGMRA
ncbi:hypothetical protein [Pseudomonas oryzae]|uniref:Uncharacterized protein n=1 Tax=Pseudomonas oryzae TaxID=1392877 RepID=A0A1H1N264_9PSED|nr:hypothetical protein [Pseudomonas oryzae]SDR92970.1 hypothetical protein SAMN05216221_0680 [Pseudomonas oryzae]